MRTFENLEGRQTPLIGSHFPGVDSLGPKAIELSRRARVAAMPWQVDIVEQMLRVDEDGLWVHGDFGLVVPRQNGKGVVLSARCLFGLFVLNERIFYTAQEFKTSADAYKRLLAMIKSRPSLARRVVKNTLSQGVGHIVLESGAEIMFISRSNNAGRGFDRIDLVIFDEAYNLTDGEIAALAPTQQASDNPQTIYTSSAVNQEQHPNGAVLASIRNRGIARDEGIGYAEFAAEEHLARDDPESWKAANPSYGVIMNEAKVRKLMKQLATPAGRKSFDVEILGRGDWPVEAELATFSVITEEEWRSMVELAPTLSGSIGLGMDRSLDRAWWAIAAAQRTSDGRIHIEVGFFRSATHTEVVDFLVDLVTMWDPCAMVTDAKSPAAVIEPLLLAADIELIKTTAQQMVTACGGFYDDASEGLLTHTDQPALTDAVEGAVKRTLPGGDWAWNKQADAIIAPLVAATLARWALISFETRASAPTASPSFDAEFAEYAGDFDVLEAAF